MNIAVNGQHMSVGIALESYIDEKLQHIITKYFDNATNGKVHFIKEGHLFRCNIIVHDGTGRHTIIKSSASCDDSYSAFDMALAKSEKQLRKYKSKLKDRHNRIKLSESSEAIKYVIAPTREDQKDNNPVIIAEKPIYVDQLSVEEAVMKMDLENLPTVMFKNTNTGRINVVYYRDDGNISWLDSL